jgi:hypothetical protein
MGTTLALPEHETRDAGAFPVCLQMERMLLKAVPSMEGGKRVLYLEASNEVRDLQGDKILISALRESIPYFLQYGRIDLDHASVLGEIRGMKVNPYMYEIGKPVDVRVEPDRIWVKVEIYSSATPGNHATDAADWFWGTLSLKPPMVWYPSVAGDVYSERPITENGLPTQEVRKIRWHGIGLSRTPVNTGVQAATTVPVRAFAKAFSGLADLKETLALLSPIAPPHAALESLEDLLEDSSVQDADPAQVQLALDALNEADPASGMGGFLSLATGKGVPADLAMAVATAVLLSPLQR